MKILIVGGGTAGLITGLILKKYLNYQIDVVRSEKIGIVGVGEGSTEHFKEFLLFCGIDHHTIVKECGATYKGGILFQNFGKKTYMHNVASPFDEKVAQYNYVYAKQISENSDYMQSKFIWENKIESWFLNKPEIMPFNQFHFDTFKLNEFLTKFSKDLGINFYDDEILDVNLNHDGSIKNIVGEKFSYDYDFYIDSTGFKKILISKLGGKWKSFKKYMKMNSAMTFQTEETEEYSLWTLANGMKYGWMFRLPTQSRYGNGYIFDDTYINIDKAKEEIESVFNREINVGRTFKFDPGAIDKPWIKNCVATGLSSLFVEPLEASSIGSTIQQAFLLMHRIPNYNERTINSYNKSFDDMVENIRDFIILHYITDRRDTEFWKDVSQIEIPESLSEKINIWKYRMPIKEDFNNYSDYIMFTENNFALVMHGLGMFDITSIKNEYHSKHTWVHNKANEIINSQKNNDLTASTIGHKDFIKLIKEYL